MTKSFVSRVSLPKSKLALRLRNIGNLDSFDLEVTARCNNNCRHCYINMPEDSPEAIAKELSFNEIKEIIDGAVSMGALWCLITGGEPLLRKDFFDIYLYAKKKGLLIGVFTNATLITSEHVRLFHDFPPRAIEITVYGVTRDTYERVTRKKGSFDAFMAGLDLLLKNNIDVRLKAMAMRSTIKELPDISSFCRQRTKDYFRFDPFLHLRYDGNPIRNEEIKKERISPHEIVAIEQADVDRSRALKEECHKLINPEFLRNDSDSIFFCNLGRNRCSISYDGYFRLCSSLCHPECVYNLKKSSISDAWLNFVPGVLKKKSDQEDFLKKCRVCPVINLCMWCPAKAYLETGVLDKPIDYFCDIAHARAEAISKG